MALFGSSILAAGLGALGLMASVLSPLPRLADGSLPGFSTPSIGLSSAIDAETGSQLIAADATRLTVGPRRPVQPVAAWGDEIVLKVDATPAPGAGSTPEFAFWNVETGERRPGWTGEPGTQEIVTDLDGDWASIVRTGFELPFADWTLLLRNLETGEVRTIAAGDPEVGSTEGLQPGLPLGFAPFASMHNGRVAWAQYARSGDRVEREVLVYDLADDSRTVVASVHPTEGHLASPSLGGDRMAWISSSPGGEEHEFVVHELSSGAEQRYRVEGHPFQLVLTADGRQLAWDDQMTAKYSFDLARRTLTRFAADEGWGVTAATEGARLSWTPAAAFGGTGGYFDVATRQTHLVEPRQGVTTNVATVLGEWFAWQESTGTETAYYFQSLARGGNG
ncbi:MAG: hypothetical protein M0R74_01025 [Dehalococcoidia bacterium]|nr:hypothetical protein [Dehalococcoidia bacterium]